MPNVMGGAEIRFGRRRPRPTVEHVEIVRPDLSDTSTADAWYEVYAGAERFERPHATPWLRPELPEQFTPSQRCDDSAWSGVVDGRIVCVGTIELPLLANTHAATLGVYTDPTQRRRGYGSQMLAHLEGLAREAGRRTSYLEVHYPLDAPEEGRGCAGPEFAVAHGYRFGLADIMRSLPMPVDPDRLATLAKGAAQHHDGYRLEAFSGRIPEEWVAAYVALESRIEVDAPSGSLEVEQGSTDVASFREEEARRARQGRLTYHAVALSGDEVVGFTTVTVPRSNRILGYQWGTLVSAEHRGHRLGLALKVANLHQVREHEPELRSIATWNAEANGPMIAVNDQLGYVPVERMGEFEKRW